MFNTPLGNIINLPDTENKLFKASVYNSLAIILLLLIAFSTVSVYFLFEIFIKPLMWALLVGSCLFPFKRSLTKFLHRWIEEMEKSRQPLLVGSVLFPFSLFFTFGEWITEVVVHRIKLFLFYIIGVPLIYSIYNVGIISSFLSSTTTIYFSASSILSIFESKLVSLMIIAMIMILFTSIIFCQNINTKMLTILSSCIWILSIVHISNFAGSFAFLLFFISIILLIVGAFVELLKIDITNFSLSELIVVWEFVTRPSKYSTKADDQNVFSEEEIFSENDASDKSFGSGIKNTLDFTNLSETSNELKDELSNDQAKGDSPTIESSKTKRNRVNFVFDTVSTTVDWCSKLFSPSSKLSPRKSFDRSFSSMTNSKRYSIRSTKKITNKTLAHRVFICLLWSHIIMYSWSHLWIILVMIVAILLVAFKKILNKLVNGDLFCRIITSSKDKLDSLLGDRKNIFFPSFIRGAFRIFLQFDEKLRKLLDSCLDNLVSIVLITFLLCGTIFLAIFLAFQVHNESLHLVALTTNVLNSTMSSELYNWLPERKDITTIIETVTSNVYIFGRQWISKKIEQLFDTNAYNKARLEEQALELWEKLYQRVLLKNATNTSIPFNQPIKNRVLSGPQYSFSSLHKHIFNFWDLLTSFDVLDINKISNFIKENLGLLSTVIESVWMVIRSNLNLFLTLLTGIFSVILGGGTVVLNFIVSLIIFLSALYYLLAYSKQLYLPMEFITTLTPNADNNPILQSIYSSIENGISSVFAVTLKMACFYGFYTSLTHTICGVNLVVIPSITAAVLAAVPIVGTYWAAVPAITELVFINQDYMSAIVLFVFHLIPMYILDTAIYSEIKETGHPYLTGLAIAGGVCWLGLQGAVIGPLLLCTLVIVLNLFKTLIGSETIAHSTPEKFADRVAQRSPKLLKKSKSCDRSSRYFMN